VLLAGCPHFLGISWNSGCVFARATASLKETAGREVSTYADCCGWGHGCSQDFFQGGQRRNFAYPFQVADDAMQVDVHKTLYPFCIPLVCAGWTSILNLLSEFFLHFGYQKCFFFSQTA